MIELILTYCLGASCDNRELVATFPTSMRACEISRSALQKEADLSGYNARFDCIPPRQYQAPKRDDRIRMLN